jgi:hypothetical protein
MKITFSDIKFDRLIGMWSRSDLYQSGKFYQWLDKNNIEYKCDQFDTDEFKIVNEVIIDEKRFLELELRYG